MNLPQGKRDNVAKKEGGRDESQERGLLEEGDAGQTEEKERRG